MKLIKEVKEKVVEHEIIPKKIILTHHEYNKLKKIFMEAVGWKDIPSCHLDHIHLFGGYRATGTRGVELRVEVDDVVGSDFSA